MKIALAVVIGLLLFHFLIVKRNGNLKFWSLAKKYPGIVFSEIENDDAWIIAEEVNEVDLKKYNGPFWIEVPRLRKRMKVYCEFDNMKESQARIIEKIDKLTKAAK